LTNSITTSVLRLTHSQKMAYKWLVKKTQWLPIPGIKEQQRIFDLADAVGVDLGGAVDDHLGINVLKKKCKLINDTDYPIRILRARDDNTGEEHFVLDPTRSSDEWLTPFAKSIDLVLVISETRKRKKNFDDYDGEEKRMSDFFAVELQEKDKEDEIEITFIGWLKIAEIPSGQRKDEEHTWTAEVKEEEKKTRTETLNCKVNAKIPLQGLDLGGDVGWEKKSETVQTIMRSTQLSFKQITSIEAQPFPRDVYAIVIKGKYTSPLHKVDWLFNYQSADHRKIEKNPSKVPTLDLETLQAMNNF